MMCFWFPDDRPGPSSRDDPLPTDESSASDSDSGAMPPGGSSGSDSEDEAPSYVRQIRKLSKQMRDNGT